MRKILFKAKRVDNGEWVTGFLTKMWGQFHIISENNENTAYPFDCKTLCQFTGMTDKNGKKIWENDILMCHGNPDDLVKAVFGEFEVRNIETGTVVDKVIGWHYEVIPTDAISRTEPFCYSMPLTKEYIERCEMEAVDNPELLQEVRE